MTRHQRSVLIGIGIAFAIVVCLGAGWFYARSVVEDIVYPEKAAEAEREAANEALRTMRREAVKALGEDSPQVAELDRLIEEMKLLYEYYEDDPTKLMKQMEESMNAPPPSIALPGLPPIENLREP